MVKKITTICSRLHPFYPPWGAGKKASKMGIFVASCFIRRTATVAVFYRLLLADSGVAETVT